MRLADKKLESVLEVLQLISRSCILFQRKEQIVKIELVLDHDHIVLLLVRINALLFIFQLVSKPWRTALRSNYLLVLRSLRDRTAHGLELAIEESIAV